ncbi:MAG: LAGLIDADG family homing endonuclease [Nanoarchaeota archaeon]|nr:LAGLIDADG family homing endonuclease [Nanoarchaeota archaeon]
MDKKKKREDLILEAKRFFDSHKKEIVEAAREGERVIRIKFSDLSKFSPELADNLIDTPEETLEILEAALEESEYVKNPRIRIVDPPHTTNISIRNIRAKHLDQFISIEGIVKQASDVRPQVINARFECPSCGAILSVLQVDRKFHDPSRCSCQWKGNFKLLSKEMVDVQRLVIEESPDSLEGGEQPRRINVFLKEDLVDPKMEERTTPGSKAKIHGILKEIPVPLPTGISTRFDIALEANNIIPTEESFEDLNIKEEDMKEILELAADPLVFKRLSQSIAPSIYGFEKIKEAVLLQIFGGVKKTKSDGGSTRGDIHILLVGDPGVAKSVMLKFISTVGPKGRYVSGKAASAAGITASVVKDEFLKGWSLEAGAMVLSNHGIICLDEIEKMSEQDRSSMHEAMEQQCYHPNLEISFPDGSKEKIGTLVNSLMEKYKNKIQPGINCEILPLEEEIKVLTTDFESIYPAKIKNLSRHKSPEELIKITLNNGREITVTPEHPCWVIRDGKITTTPAEKLSNEEFFPIPAELPIEGEEQTFAQKPWKNGPQLCKLLGYHISDGCCELNRGKKNGIQFSNKNSVLIEDYKNSINSLFNLVPGITKKQEVFSVRVISKEVAEFMHSLDKNLMEKGILKVIPDKIMKCKKEDLAFLLRALFDGDGTVVNVKRNGLRIGLITENKKLAEQVAELLLRFGIISSIYKDEEFYRLDITGEENILKYYENIGFLSDKKQNRIKEYLSKTRTFRSVTDIIPNVTPAIADIFKKLKINQQKYLGNQICMNCNKHRNFLQKMTKIAEEKVERLFNEKENLLKTLNTKKLGQIRKNLELSALYISEKLGISDYLLGEKEKKELNDENYQKVLLYEIESMLSILPTLREIKRLAFGKIKWAKIKSVERIKADTKWVYDITIEPTHSFISNNMVLHNSVTIAKANIHATLRAETTVLAAGNPKLGRFDPYTPIPQQIDISPALLSRFDVIFIIRDLPNKVQDEAIASHVLQEHTQEVIRDIVKPKLMRKYVAYAKQKIKPKLTEEAINEIKNFYVKLRNQSIKSDSEIKPIPITARQLEGIIRLAEAHAKLHLRKTVTAKDAQTAIDLLKTSLSQVGYDEETQTFDIDKITTGISSSKRGKIVLVKETLSHLEAQLGKLIPIEEIEKALENKITKPELDEAIDQLSKMGDIFKPKQGFIQKI